MNGAQTPRLLTALVVSMLAPLSESCAAAVPGATPEAHPPPAGTPASGGEFPGDIPTDESGPPTAITEPPTPPPEPTPGPPDEPTAAAPPPTPAALFDLLAHQENVSCNYIPGGAIDGSDQLTVNFYFSLLYATPSDLDRLVRIDGNSDTGLSTVFSSAVDNQAVTAAQFRLRPTDFGRTHTIALLVDADNYYPEIDEANNTVTVRVTLPATRPTALIDPLPCG